MSNSPEYRKKLIEVALPLDAINRAAAREKSIRQGHPSTFHIWWARRPLAACRAVLFAQLVDDPSAHPEIYPTVEQQDAARDRLFELIEQLVEWDNLSNHALMAEANRVIRASVGEDLPTILDPFMGGGSIPLEAQRLGLPARGSDLNPVSVAINKAMIEVSAVLGGRAPIHASERRLIEREWTGAEGLAADVRHYGHLVLNCARETLGPYYADDTARGAESVGWLWARTVTCPNPACRATAPLFRSLVLEQRGGGVYLETEVARDSDRPRVVFTPHLGTTSNSKGTMARDGGTCLVCGSPIPTSYLREQGMAASLGYQMTSKIVQIDGKRQFLAVSGSDQLRALNVDPGEGPNAAMSTHPQYMAPPRYGMTTFQDLFLPRQLLALNEFVKAVEQVAAQVERDAVLAGMENDPRRLDEGGRGSRAYSDAIRLYLALTITRLTNRLSTLCMWDAGRGTVQQVFARQALSMTWDFAEANPFSDSTGGYVGQVEYLAKALERFPAHAPAVVEQLDATQLQCGTRVCVSTDPPYYDNVPYADLSDYFYVWLRPALKDVFPSVFSTMLVPKNPELVADHVRHGGKTSAKDFFEQGLRKTFQWMRECQDPALPVTLYYAFKQSETTSGGDSAQTASTGWETMLKALIETGFRITATWPMRTEQPGGLREVGRNALASSIVLACRPRDDSAQMATRREFISQLRVELPGALRNLQHGNVAPVDLAQAAIGPGMATFSAYGRVIEADGSSMSVRTALGIINQVLDEVLAEQEGEYDPSTRWALAWFEQVGHEPGSFGQAEVLSKAKAISIATLSQDGFVDSRANKVRLLRREELSDTWDPATDKHLTAWEITQYLTRALEQSGEEPAATLLHSVGPALGEIARDLAYRLYALCERKGWAKDAMPYNALVVAWPELVALAAAFGSSPQQTSFLEE